MKHLTFKTVFLLALGSSKHRSEIHAWQNRNIRHQSDWSKVSLYPSPSFLSKNQLAKEGPDSGAPVVIPALAPTLDRSLKSDRSLCLVRALRYYLDRISDLRQNKQLVFVSFKKGFDKDISPATISSWIKQTVILCHELSDQEAHTLHQVKAHDVRAFAASKAFQSGVSLEQILSACHWKSHNTFTQFCLKDVVWADSELYHLSFGPVNRSLITDYSLKGFLTIRSTQAWKKILLVLFMSSPSSLPANQADTQDPTTDPAISLLGV